jgi:hypothetical protein
VAQRAAQLSLIASVAGALVPFRPLFFERADQATEMIDLMICPMYVIGRLLPPMGDFGSLSFLAVAVVANTALYGFVAHYLLHKFSSGGSTTLTQQRKG